MYIIKFHLAPKLERNDGLVDLRDHILAGLVHQFHQAFDGAQPTLQR